MDYLFLDSRRMPDKSRKFLHQLYRSAIEFGADCKISYQYEHCRALVLYGLGGPDRWDVGTFHMKQGGTLMAFDLGYWDRKLPYRKYRFSLNGLHPGLELMRVKYDAKRLQQSDIRANSVKYNKRGPVMLVGNAPKSIAVGAENWTAKMSISIRETFKEKKILYRPKPKRPPERGVICDQVSKNDIFNELKKCSLVVCRHSNVAVDCARLGVPCVATHGAAQWLYPNRLNDYQQQPSQIERQAFLERLAYWQWGRHETQLFWQWFFKTFPVHDYR